MAGQGTVALEFHSQADLDVVLVPMSGGGLMAGCAVATASLRPDCHLVGVEPDGAADSFASLAAGTRQQVDAPHSIADGLLVADAGRDHVPHQPATRRRGRHRERRVRSPAAMRVLFERTKQVVEPSGAVGVAALLDDHDFGGHRVGVVLSGGNVGPEPFARLVG